MGKDNDYWSTKQFKRDIKKATKQKKFGNRIWMRNRKRIQRENVRW